MAGESRSHNLARKIRLCLAVYYGMGRQYDDIAHEDYAPMLQALYATRILYVFSLMCVKMSLLTFYLRLDHRRYMKWTVYAIMFIAMGVGISSFLTLVLSCLPPSKFWDLDGTAKGHCISPNSLQAFYEANRILNIITDTLIYIVPIPMLWGVTDLDAGAVRYDFVRKLAHNPDIYHPLADSLNWCSIEISVGTRDERKGPIHDPIKPADPLDSGLLRLSTGIIRLGEDIRARSFGL
ncbi:hypothetical protein BJX70DRAFT_400212 [Aspergillus crustosus]